MGMSPARFDAILEARIEKMKSVLSSKAGEYAASNDRLHNFRHAAAFMRTSTAGACMAFMTKHLISIADMVEGVAQGKKYPVAVIDEKIGDAMNYLALLEAIFLESTLG